MEYDCSDSFPSDYEPSGILFGSLSKGNLLLRSYFFKLEKSKKSSSVSVCRMRHLRRLSPVQQILEPAPLVLQAEDPKPPIKEGIPDTSNRGKYLPTFPQIMVRKSQQHRFFTFLR